MFICKKKKEKSKKKKKESLTNKHGVLRVPPAFHISNWANLATTAVTRGKPNQHGPSHHQHYLQILTVHVYNHGLTTTNSRYQPTQCDTGKKQQQQKLSFIPCTAAEQKTESFLTQVTASVPKHHS